MSYVVGLDQIATLFCDETLALAIAGFQAAFLSIYLTGLVFGRTIKLCVQLLIL